MKTSINIRKTGGFRTRARKMAQIAAAYKRWDRRHNFIFLSDESQPIQINEPDQRERLLQLGYSHVYLSDSGSLQSLQEPAPKSLGQQGKGE